jgi:hypothetical protein
MDFSAKMFRDIPGVVKHHYKEGNINWPMGIYISLVHVIATVGLFKIADCSVQTLMWAFILWPIRYEPYSLDNLSHCILIRAASYTFSNFIL